MQLSALRGANASRLGAVQLLHQPVRGGNGHPVAACFQAVLGIAGAWENGSAQHEALLHSCVFALEVSWNS